MQKIAKTEPCASCNVPCCKRFVVPITGFDLLRILELGGRARGICRLVDSTDIELSDHSTVFILEQGELREKSLVLRRVDGICGFFREGRCSIWSKHPYACKTYPFVEREDKIGYAKTFVCPREWRKDDYSEKRVLEEIERMSEEIAEHNKIVRFWNANFSKNKDEDQFFDYLISEIKKRERFNGQSLL